MYNYLEFRDEMLVAFHNLAWEALNYDDGLPPEKDKKYGVREFPDWKIHIEEMEKVLKVKNLPFKPIPI